MNITSNQTKTNTNNIAHSCNHTHALPIDGCSRASTLSEVLDISKATIWAWTKQGKFPKPMRLSSTITVWRNADIIQWLDEKTQQTNDTKADAKPVNDDDFSGGAA